MAPIPARRPPPPWPHESFRVGAALAASVSDLEEGCQGRGDLQGALRKSSYRSTQSPLHVPVPSLATKTVFPGGAADHYPIFSFSSVEATFRTLGQRFQRFSPLLAAPAALLLSQGQAKAVLTYNVFESAGNVVVQASGSLDLSSTSSFAFQNSCAAGAPGGAIYSSFAIICTGTEIASPAFTITGPASFNGSVAITPASSVSGILTGMVGISGAFAIDPSYIYNTPIVSSATFNGQTLASLGFTTTGLIGTWTIDGTSESIQVFLGPPSTAAVPGPMPLLGAAAAFGFSRRLRKRIAAPLSTPPQA